MILKTNWCTLANNKFIIIVDRRALNIASHIEAHMILIEYWLKLFLNSEVDYFTRIEVILAAIKFKNYFNTTFTIVSHFNFDFDDLSSATTASVDCCSCFTWSLTHNFASEADNAFVLSYDTFALNSDTFNHSCDTLALNSDTFDLNSDTLALNFNTFVSFQKFFTFMNLRHNHIIFHTPN